MKKFEINTQKSKSVHKAIVLQDFALSKILKNESFDNYLILIIIFKTNIEKNYFYAIEKNSLFDFKEHFENVKGENFWQYSSLLIKNNIIKKLPKKETPILINYIQIADFL